VSGCESHQTSADDFIHEKFNGVLTHYLLKSLSNGGMSKPMIEVVKEVNQMIDAIYEQNPQISGADFLKQRKFLS
jgi:hypothetical protein